MRSVAVPLLVALVFIMKTGAAEARCDLTGPWTCGGDCKKPGGTDHASQTGNSITFIGEDGASSQGVWQDESTVVNFTEPQKHIQLVGHVTGDCKQINWDNHTYWLRN
ncbi:hypothetical protein AWB67_05629 [Caballeronia terrestris]|uniref:Lipoprotein n=1 Tax=Caballeronia terrestris TaxID=1226301 RepID=A0A158KH49_9BURK|nr:hypothetical protein [Caballeronia terrestris]SAL80468.1 hypothetical protein AWB67_05629 [Caballeronia terrestris]